MVNMVECCTYEDRSFAAVCVLADVVKHFDQGGLSAVVSSEAGLENIKAVAYG